MITEKYVTQGQSIAQISSELACSKDAIKRTLMAAGASIRSPGHHHGRPSQPKYGEQYRKGKLVRHLGEARVKATIGEMRASGLSLRQIAKFLDHIGVPTKCRGKKWHPQMVKRVLGNSLETNAITAISTNERISNV